MNNQLVNTKKLSNEINRAFTQMQKAKNDYVFSVINLGEKLLEAKEYVGFGAWEDYINRNSEFRFDARQARKYMQIAMHKDLVIALFKDGDMRPSVNQITKSIASATPEQLEAAKTVHEPNDDSILGLVMEKSMPTPDELAEAIDGEFIEIEPEQTLAAEPMPEAEGSFSDGDLIAELQSLNDELTAENERMQIVFDDDNHIAAAMAENKKLSELVRVLNERINGLLSEKNEAIRSAKYWKRKFDQIEKQVKGAANE